MTTTKMRRARRQFTDEYKAAAVKLVLDEGRTPHSVAADLDLTESALRLWVERAKASPGRSASAAMTTTEREELARLRKENRVLRMERDILKRAAAFFAKESA
jgi:transposase